MKPNSVFLDEVREAAQALTAVTTRTPLLANPDMDIQSGGRLLIKAENLQRSGAFNIRGAYNAMRQLSATQRKQGVIAYSSGNHALGLALAARELESSALIVMPRDVPASKIAAVRALGVDIETYDRNDQSFDDIVMRLSIETGRIIIPPSGNDHILAGAATAPLELYEQAQELGVKLDAVLVPCGGGGLTAATALIFNELSHHTEIYAVEPECFDDTRRSIKAGRRVENPKGQSTICDAIMTSTPNVETFKVNQSLLAGVLVASDDDVVEAMHFAFINFKIVLEPGAAVGIAAVLNGQYNLRGKKVATISTGGNIELGRFCALNNSGSRVERKHL